MAFDNSNMTLCEIEKLEHKYLMKYWYFLKFVEDEMAQGHDVILEIEVQGAMNIREQYPDSVLIFVSAPSAESLRDRIFLQVITPMRECIEIHASH